MPRIIRAKDVLSVFYFLWSEDGESPQINFGCISRDGYIFISDDEEIIVDNIQGAHAVITPSCSCLTKKAGPLLKHCC